MSSASDGRHKEEYRPGIASNVAIGQHALHPSLISFPIPTLVGAPFTDLVDWRTTDAFWVRPPIG